MSLDISNNNNINEPGIDPEFLELMREKEAADKLWFKETQKITNKELEEFEKLALQIVDETEHTYDAMMKILQKGLNLREAIIIGMIIGRKEGYLQAESDMEEEIKDKLYQAFRGNRNQ